MGGRVTEPVDDKFYDRADAIIHLANEQNHDIGRGMVSASLMYAAARFNAWISACGFQSGSEMQEAKQKTIDYFEKQYRAMLEENLDDYIRNFDAYMKKAH
jgi:hypothetical protein